VLNHWICPQSFCFSHFHWQNTYTDAFHMHFHSRSFFHSFILSSSIFSVEWKSFISLTFLLIVIQNREVPTDRYSLNVRWWACSELSFPISWTIF
jgi:hypothetical protein